ncbi:MAG: DMT family transporter [Verrucomicrobiota bacterium]|nr:DMT family transporter [Chthoniobacterales bacterium]MBA3762475.1 DMT family transporter [Chthoniobacterales bacterium]MDQ3314718.1 DMT family transporter [Verrucomicrobiota bacterium]
MPRQEKLRIIAAYAILCVVWSSTWLAIKVGLADLPPISFAALRFLIAFIVLLAVSIGRVPLLPKNRADWLLLAFTGVLMFAVNYGLLFWGELHISSGLAAVLQAMIVIFGMLFAHFLLPKEPLRWQRVAGALLAGGGVALICGRLLEHGGMLAFWGGLGVVVGGGGAALSNVLLKRRALELAPAMIAGWQMIFGTIPMLFLGLAVDGNPLRFHWTGRAIFCLLYLAVIGSALTFLLLYWLLPRIPVNNLQTISLITPPGAVAIGWLLGGEEFTLWSLVGGALVLAGVWMIFRRVEPVEVPLKCEAAMPRA